MEQNIAEAVKIAVEKHPRTTEKIIQYGTSGFRARASELDYIIYRMGLLAAVRACHKKATVGAMVTASHNPVEDNGIKLVDPQGDMLEITWEAYATQIVNVSDSELGSLLQDLLKEVGSDTVAGASVAYACDTRPSSECLSQTLGEGIKVLGVQAKDFGVLTTPQLHYVVRCINSHGAYGHPSEQGYYDKLAGAFKLLRGTSPSSNGSYKPLVMLDGANGVGALKMNAILGHLGETLQVEVVNDGSQGILNHNCGADFVKVQQRAPEGLQMAPGVRCVSFDGDADRIVYFYQTTDGQFRLLDGDKIATLIAGFLRQLVAECGLDLGFGLVQTAYANGSSTAYITDKLGLPVACVETGVKHLHHKAKEYDVGIYFEANGHGTVLFSDNALQKIHARAEDTSRTDTEKIATKRLLDVIDLINQTVGDAISDFLLVEMISHAQGWGLDEWNSSYTDLPYRQLKVKVEDRTVIKTTDAARRAVAPPGLQQAIDALLPKYQKARSFVRPSGTEDVVRVHAEADTQASADLLAHEVSIVVHRLAGGIGDPPTLPQ